MRIRIAMLIGTLAILGLAATIGQAQASSNRARLAAAMVSPAVARSLLETATSNGQVAQPVSSPDPSAPADGTRRCYNQSWTKSWLEAAGAKIGQVEEFNKGYCARSKQRIVTDYGWHGQSWAWGPWCITNYDSFHAWKDIPFSKQGTATGSVGVQYPWGCGGVRTIHATHIITASGRTYGKY